MKKKLTKKERKQTYLSAINIILKKPTIQHFVCCLVGEVLGWKEGTGKLDLFVNEETLPELLMFKQFDGAWLSHQYLWECDFRQEVINEYKLNVLYLCVEMCK